MWMVKDPHNRNFPPDLSLEARAKLELAFVDDFDRVLPARHPVDTKFHTAALAGADRAAQREFTNLARIHSQRFYTIVAFKTGF
jgi:hypothetical protein